MRVQDLLSSARRSEWARAWSTACPLSLSHLSFEVISRAGDSIPENYQGHGARHMIGRVYVPDTGPHLLLKHETTSMCFTSPLFIFTTLSPGPRDGPGADRARHTSTHSSINS